MAGLLGEGIGVLAAVAPVLANAIGGPLAGMAVTAVINALGLAPDAKPEAVGAALSAATPDQLLALKKADQDFAAQMKSLDVDFARLSAGDAASARARDIAVHDSTPAVLAYGLTLGFFGLLWLMVFHDVPAVNAGAVNILLGSLGTAWIASMNFFFGSTYGSKTKDQMLYNSVPASSAAAALPGRAESPAQRKSDDGK